MTRRVTTIQPPLARDPARGDWRAHPEAGPEAETLAGDRSDALSRQQPAGGAHPVTGQPPAASQAHGPEAEVSPEERPAGGAHPVTGQPPPPSRADG